MPEGFDNLMMYARRKISIRYVITFNYDQKKISRKLFMEEDFLERLIWPTRT